MDDMDRLWIGAALTSGWPTLSVSAPDEEGMLGARRVAEELLGALPQAVEWEPWEEGEPWGLEVDLPGADPERLIATVGRLRDAGLDVQVRPGLRPGAAWAAHRGMLVQERLGSGPIRATLAVDPAIGGDGRPDVRVAAAPVDEVARDLVTALQDAGLRVAFASDAGPDTVEPVVHRATGRRGIRVHFGSADIDRDRVVDAIAAVVRDRAASDAIRLAPDLQWDVATGFTVTVWVVAPPLARPAGDRLDAPSRDALVAMIAGLGDAVDTLEVHAVPAHPHLADAVVDAIAAWPLPGVDLVGAAPRWVGSPPRFALVWTLPSGAPGPVVADWAARVAAAPELAALRVVPGGPVDLQERWPRLDVAWRVYGDMAFMRLRDWIADRDVLPEGRRAVPPPWSVAFAGLAGVYDIHGVADHAGGVGLALELDPTAADPRVLDGILGVIAGARPTAMSTLGYVGMRGDRAIVHLRPIRATGGPR